MSKGKKHDFIYVIKYNHYFIYKVRTIESHQMRQRDNGQKSRYVSKGKKHDFIYVTKYNHYFIHKVRIIESHHSSPSN